MSTVKKLTSEGRKLRTRLRKLLKASDSATFSQACELMTTLRMEADMQLILNDMLQGITVSASGQVQFENADLWKRAKTQFRESLGWNTLLSSGRLQELSAVDLSFKGSLVGVTIDALKAALGQSTGLKKLNLSRCPQLENVDFLSASSSLVELDIQNSALQNIDGLHNASQLQQLTIRAQKITSFAPLSNLTELTELALYGAVIENVDVLKHCTKLQKLDLTGSTVANIDALVTCKQLKEIKIWSCTNLKRLDALQHCTQLITINATQCTSLISVAGLNKLPKLSSLLLGGCVSLQGIDELTDLPSLHTLIMHAVPLHSLDAVVNFSALRSLTFGGKAHPTNPSLPHPLNCEALLQLTNLSQLTISHFDQLQDLQLLRNCRSLHTLYLNSCTQLHSLDAIKELPALELLKLHLCKSLPRHLRGSFQNFKGKALQKLLSELA